MLRNLLVCGTVVALTGCGAIMVTANNQQLDGIPFYSKVPVMTQETKLLKSELLVTFTLGKVGADGKMVLPLVYPPSGALVIAVKDRTAADEVVSQMYLDVAKKTTLLDAQTVVAAALAELKKRSTVPTDETISNAWSVQMITGPQTYYINTRMPLIGTASGTYKLSPDGTLTEGTAAVTDDTIKTILSLLPINAKLSLQWGITAPPKLATESLVPGPPAAATEVLRVDVAMVEQRTITTLRKVEKPILNGDYVTPKPSPPLLETDVNTGAVQLVSKEVVVGSGEEKAKPDTTSYKIQGTFTPPKAPDAK